MPSTKRPHLLGLRPHQLVAVVADQGGSLSLRQARRMLDRSLGKGIDDLRLPGQPLARATQAVLEGAIRRDPLVVLDRVVDPTDGSLRYLLQSPDGAQHEAVRIPLHKAGHFSVCLSSQVGCAMACDFCATGRLGLSRSLDAWEMVAAWRLVRDEAPGRVTGAVFMGQGEPLHNYDAVMQAAAMLSMPCGGRIARKAITISTVGLVPQIRRFTREGHKYRLIVSLTSAVPQRRARLLPVASHHSLTELASALREYHAATRQRVTIAWVLIGGVNAGQDEVDALRSLLGDVPLRINLIDVNDARPAAAAYRRATNRERNAFLDGLAELRVPLVRRYSVGQGQSSACGMLSAVHPAGALPADPPA